MWIEEELMNWNKYMKEIHRIWYRKKRGTYQKKIKKFTEHGKDFTTHAESPREGLKELQHLWR